MRFDPRTRTARNIESGVLTPIEDWMPNAATGIIRPPDFANLRAWYDPSNPSTITGSPVSQLDDLSGNGRHLTQSTVGSRPATGAATQNGLNLLSFDGGDSLTFDDTGAVVAGDYTAAIVTNPTTRDATLRFPLLIQDTADGDPIIASLICSGAGTPLYGFWRNSAGTTAVNHGATSATGMCLLVYTWTGGGGAGGLICRKNGVSSGAGTAVGSLSANMDFINIGSSLIGTVGEIAIWDTDHTANIAAIENYFNKKWALF